MGNVRMLLISSISLIFLVNIAISDDSKYVKINIDAKWPQTPFVLEASEFISNLDEEKFWKFIEYFKDVRIQQNTIGSYNSLLEASRTLLSELELDLLKFVLSTRSLSPRIQVYRQLSSEMEMPECETIYSYENRNYCEYDELISQLFKAKEGVHTTTHIFDHVYPGSENNSQIVILYGLIGTESFLDAHKKVVELSANGNVKYIFRHYAKSLSEGKVHLSGYGVELAIKSTEYKAVDDQKVDGKDGGKLASGHHDDEEEVEGFLFGKLRELHPEFVEPLANFKTHLKESTKELAPLKVWQLQDLSFQAAQRIMSSSPDQRLKVLRHLSQNIPMLARSLVKTSVKEELREEIKDNQQRFKELQIEPGEAALFINGLQIQIDSLDTFSLEKLLLREMVAMKELDQLGLEVEKAGELLTLDLKPQHDSFAVDIRSESVQWLNDLEKDSQYTYWPSNIEEILRPTFPGMLRYIAKNIFHVVFCINPTDFDSIKRFNQAQDLVANSLPARIGVLFVANGSPDSDGRLDAGVGLVRAFSFIKGEKSPKEAFDFVVEVYRRSEQRPPAPNDVTDLFKRWYGEDDLNDAMSPNTDYDDLRKDSYRLFHKLGLKALPQVLINGNLLTEEEMKGLEQSLVEKILALTPGIQQATYMGHIHSHPTVYDYVMSESNVVKRLNPSIQTVAGPYLPMANTDSTHRTDNFEDMKSLPTDQLVEVLSKDVKYFLNEKGAVTTWVVVDADTASGRKMIKSALEFIESTEGTGICKQRLAIEYQRRRRPQLVKKTQKLSKVHTEEEIEMQSSVLLLKDSKTTRLSLVLCPSKENTEQRKFTFGHVLQSIIDAREKMISSVAKFILKVIDEKNDFDKLVENPDSVAELASDAKGFNKNKLLELLSEESARKRTINKLSSYRYTMEKSFEYTDEQSFVICNGRVIGPVKESSLFTLDDFDLLQSFESNRCSSKIHRIVEDMSFVNMPTDGHDRYRSDMVMKISGILSSQKQSVRTKLNFHGDRHSVLHVEPTRKNSISYDVVAVIDPLTADAQKIVPILMVIINVTNVNLRIFFNCKDKLSEMPLKRDSTKPLEKRCKQAMAETRITLLREEVKTQEKTPRFYRYVLSPELTFDADGILSNTAPAVFRNMPQSALLTVIMDTPQSWMVEAKNSPYDLDNIHLAEVDNNVYGDFELEYIVVEGHCQEALSGAPPRGLQFTLGTKSKPEMFDTIVMANLGYFQLKAFPGSFSLKLREGRSSDIYKIDSIEGSDDHADEGHFTVTVDSFEGSFLKAKVSRNPGKDNEDLLSGDEKSKGIWDSITSYVNKDHADIGKNGTVHIFSVATGRLYERFLRIMMLTVLKHTKNPVKFWFLKNYLSSTFTSFLPYMAKEYNFDYALVQYQWPSWLHRQTDKQRIIWGYKILFLDVLFPLNLNRVIFVDADQVVRTDLKELMEMDLEGAPYAYTPFCSDRTEMDGFRFWNQGYWKSHLAGRPYHISALYVVDLKQFRKMAAGDRLRGQYQGLSQDPNSLANLDQDLPNNMIHQVPIKSLPQEWLWCETWCSDESKKIAKTIDLCNNPQTKEPKLKRATRIVEEWPELDAEIMRLQEKVAKENITGKTFTVEIDETKKKDEL